MATSAPHARLIGPLSVLAAVCWFSKDVAPHFFHCEALALSSRVVDLHEKVLLRAHPRLTDVGERVCSSEKSWVNFFVEQREMF